MGRKPTKKYCIGIVLTDPRNEGKKRRDYFYPEN